MKSLPTEIPYFIVAAMLGALLGTQAGLRWLTARTLQRILAIVVFIAASKFILT